MLTDQFTSDMPSPGLSRPTARTARRVEPVGHAPAGASFLTSAEPGSTFGVPVDVHVDAHVDAGVPTS